MNGRWHLGMLVLALIAAFPALASASHDKDEPLVLADGLELLYYMDRGPADQFSTTQFLGEIRNTTEFWYDAPNLQVLLYDESDNILGSVGLTPLFLVIGPGQTLPVSGYFDQSDPTDFDHVAIAPCDPWPATNSVEEYRPDGLVIEEFEEIVRTENEFQAEAFVRNNDDDQRNNVAVVANIYTGGGHYVGSSTGQAPAPIPIGKTARVVIDINVDLFSTNDPLALVGKDWKYELMVGHIPFARFTCGD